MHIQISIPKIWGRAAYPEGAHYDGRTLFPAGFDPDVSIRMQKPGSSRKSSGMRITPFTFVALGALAIVLFRFMSPHTSAELHNSKPTKTLNADSEIEVGSDVNKPKHALRPNVQSTTHSAPAAPRTGVTSTLVAIESYTQFTGVLNNWLRKYG